MNKKKDVIDTILWVILSISIVCQVIAIGILFARVVLGM